MRWVTTTAEFRLVTPNVAARKQGTLIEDAGVCSLGAVDCIQPAMITHNLTAGTHVC